MSEREKAPSDGNLLPTLETKDCVSMRRNVRRSWPKIFLTQTKSCTNFFKFCGDINELLRSQETDSRKNFRFNNNPAFDPLDEKFLLKNVLDFICETLKVKNRDRYSFKVYHLMPPPTLLDNLMLPIIKKNSYSSTTKMRFLQQGNN